MIDEKSLSKSTVRREYGLQNKIREQLLTVTGSKGGVDSIGS